MIPPKEPKAFDEYAKEAAEKYAEEESSFCRCAGFTCSGCESKTMKNATSDFLAGLDWQHSRDAQTLSEMRGKLDRAIAFVKSKCVCGPSLCHYDDDIVDCSACLTLKSLEETP